MVKSTRMTSLRPTRKLTMSRTKTMLKKKRRLSVTRLLKLLSQSRLEKPMLMTQRKRQQLKLWKRMTRTPRRMATLPKMMLLRLKPSKKTTASRVTMSKLRRSRLPNKALRMPTRSWMMTKRLSATMTKKLSKRQLKTKLMLRLLKKMTTTKKWKTECHTNPPPIHIRGLMRPSRLAGSEHTHGNLRD